ncbi:hypothetical protein [Malikia sp.]|uniref:hypothetical protein n=1 Tax=Malikia sp. TaxID=2070706 RepID=UPI002620FECF|nr:hypothetical protein [Malikia sp.]MDD2728187.1 hypothetical protein [Malikia sp.]
MDTSRTAADVEQAIRDIKSHMPETYQAILERAKESDLGRQAYALVRRGIKGEANCFYAIERGRVVGAPFSLPDVTAEMARYMVQFGCSFMIMWQPGATKGKQRGQA